MKEDTSRKKYGKKESGTTRSEVVMFRLTNKERAILNEVANKRGVTLSHLFQDFISVLSSHEANHIPSNFLKMALAICDVSASEKVCELVISIIGELHVKGGDFSVNDALRLKFDNDKKYEQAEINA